MATLGPNYISGITTTVFESNDVVSKQYVEDNIPTIQPVSGNADKFLITTDGTSLTWEYLSGSEEYTTSGIHTFNVPSHANLLYIEATGGGAGGSAGFDGSLLSTSVSYLNTTTEGDKIAWSAFSLSGFAYEPESSVVYGNGFYLAGGRLRDLFASTDSIHWQARTSGSFPGTSSLTYGNGLYVGCGEDATLRVSTDTIHWVLRTTGQAVSSKIDDVMYANGNFYAVGFGYYYATSTDTITWILRTLGIADNEPRRIIYGSGSHPFLAAAMYGHIVSSTDGISWSQRTSPSGTASFGYGIAHDNGLFLHAASGVSVSTDTIHWTLRTVGSTQGVFDGGAAVHNGNWIVAHEYVQTSHISVSTDSITWSQVSLNSSFSRIERVSYAHNGFYIGASTPSATYYYLKNRDSGYGGASGSYSSWYVPKQLISSNITVNIGSGGTGGSSANEFGYPGAATSFSWTGPGGSYVLSSPGASFNGPADHIISSGYYSIRGIGGYDVLDVDQSTTFQSSGGGKGSFDGFVPSQNGGQINVYGISTFASGASNFTSANGSDGTTYSKIPYGSGGGGGGSTTSAAGNGGAGGRGAGGGGAGFAVNTSTTGVGGTGGIGYAKITWW